jgi:hypothetical protein
MYCYVLERLKGFAFPSADDSDDLIFDTAGLNAPMFAGGVVAEPVAAVDDGSPARVAVYREQLAAITERTQISKIAGHAGHDPQLTPDGRKAVAALATEAGKLWPNKLSGGSQEQAAPDQSAPDQASANDPQAEQSLIREFDQRLENARDLAALDAVARDWNAGPSLQVSPLSREIFSRAFAARRKKV